MWWGDSPVLGTIYTVRAIGNDTLSGEPGVWLNEIRNDGDGVDDAYKARRFRKVQKRKSSLTFESFLTIKPGFEEPRRVTTPKPVKEKA